MEVIYYVIMAGLAFFSGWFLVRYLTVHPVKMSAALTLTLLFFVAALVVLITQLAILRLYISIPVLIIAFLSGYALQTRAFLNTRDMRTSPELLRQPGDPGDGHTAIIYFTHGEPETYDPIGWINQFREFDEQGISFVPWLIRPVFAYKLRNGYLRIGRSNHVSIHRQMIGSLEQSYRLEGDDKTKFYLSFLDASPTPEAAAIQALNEGASRVIVCEVFLTVSNHTAEGENQIRELNIEERFGVPVSFTHPLFDSETLKQMFIERIKKNTDGTDKNKIGILLVGHGQPDEWDREWPTETQQELGFREAIIELFTTNGYSQDNCSLAWMEFKRPKPALKVEEFIRNGVENICYFSAAISADSMHSQYDVPELIRKARIPSHIKLSNMGAWNDDPLVIQAIREKIDKVLRS